MYRAYFGTQQSVLNTEVSFKRGSTVLKSHIKNSGLSEILTKGGWVLERPYCLTCRREGERRGWSDRGWRERGRARWERGRWGEGGGGGEGRSERDEGRRWERDEGRRWDRDGGRTWERDGGRTWERGGGRSPVRWEHDMFEAEERSQSPLETEGGDRWR